METMVEGGEERREQWVESDIYEGERGKGRSGWLVKRLEGVGKGRK